MKLIVGLGNPGNNYKNTRHNIGFQLLDFIAKEENISFNLDKKFNAEDCEMIVNGEKVILVKPLTFMNLSGDSVSKYYHFYNLNPSDIIVIHDDLDMVFGKVRVVFDSSSGGHNGIKDIIAKIGSKEFTRLKVGIAHDKSIDTKDYVLGKFSKEQEIFLNDLYVKLKDIPSDFVNMDILNLKQKYNDLVNIK